MKNKKFNIIDLLIILLIVAVICAGVFAYMYFFKSSDNSVNTNTVNIQFTIEVNGITEDAANSFKVGDSVTLGASASGSGVIKNTEVKEYRMITSNEEDGTYQWTGVPGEYTALVTVESNVVKTDTAYTTGSEVISVGKQMPFNARGAASEKCYIVDLNEVK